MTGQGAVRSISRRGKPHLGEGRVALLLRVEGADTHEAVDTCLTPQPPVGAVADHLTGPGAQETRRCQASRRGHMNNAVSGARLRELPATRHAYLEGDTAVTRAACLGVGVYVDGRQAQAFFRAPFGVQRTQHARPIASDVPCVGGVHMCVSGGIG